MSVSAAARSKTGSQAARDSSAIPDSVVIENTGSPVEIDGKPILFVYAHIGGFTPQDRADAIQQHIIALSDKRNVAIEAIHAEDRGSEQQRTPPIHPSVPARAAGNHS